MYQDQKKKLDSPADNGWMIDNDAVFLHHLFEIAIAKWISWIPSDTNCYHL